MISYDKSDNIQYQCLCGKSEFYKETSGIMAEGRGVGSIKRWGGGTGF